MTSILDEVKSAYHSISSVLEKLNDSTFCFISDLNSNLQNRPKIKVFDGFTEISENFSISTPENGNCELRIGEAGEIIFDSTPTDWIAVSLKVGPHVEFQSAIAEIESKAGVVLHADLQLRTFFEEGTYTEGPISEWAVPPHALTTASIPAKNPEGTAKEGSVDKRTVVLHFRTPPTSFALKSMRFFLI